MPRMPRFFVPDTPLHLIVRGNNRGAIFACDDDCAFMHGYLRHAAGLNALAIHAYVFMTNHVHLLVTPSTAASVPRAIQMLGRTYVRYFNDKYSRTGTLWEGRYKASIVDHEHYLVLCMRYIELNPVRAGMVRMAGEYRWSSFLCNARGAADSLVTKHALYTGLGSDQRMRESSYRAMFGVGVPDKEIDRIRDATQNGWALGSKSFRDRVGSM